MEQVAQLFTDQQAALRYFDSIKQAKPRYIRDQLSLSKKAINTSNAAHADQALSFCQSHKILSANDFRAVLDRLSQDEPPPEPELEDLLLQSIDRSHYNASPHKSNISDYESIVNPQ